MLGFQDESNLLKLIWNYLGPSGTPKQPNIYVSNFSTRKVLRDARHVGAMGFGCFGGVGSGRGEQRPLHVHTRCIAGKTMFAHIGVAGGSWERMVHTPQLSICFCTDTQG